MVTRDARGPWCVGVTTVRSLVLTTMRRMIAVSNLPPPAPQSVVTMLMSPACSPSPTTMPPTTSVYGRMLITSMTRLGVLQRCLVVPISPVGGVTVGQAVLQKTTCSLRQLQVLTCSGGSGQYLVPVLQTVVGGRQGGTDSVWGSVGTPVRVSGGLVILICAE